MYNYTATICYIVMTNLYDLNIHVIKIHVERKTHCLVCSKYVPTVSLILFFMTLIHLLEIRTRGLSLEGLENV